MAIRSVRRQATRPGAYQGTANAAPIYVDSDDSRLKVIPGGQGATDEYEIQHTGPGGAVTQITSASTGVTLSKERGQITTVALTTVAGAEERFTVTNTTVSAADVIALSTTYNGAGTPMLSVANVTAGAFDIVITNAHAANAFNAVMVINFVVLQGATS